MRTYGRAWWLVVVPLAALGATEALLAVPRTVAVVAAILAGLLAGLAGLACLSRETAGPGSGWSVASVAVRGAGLGVVMAGLAVVLGGAAAGVFVLAVCLHPRVLGRAGVRVRRWWSSRDRRRPRRGGVEDARDPGRVPCPDAEAVRRLSTPQLCWEWRVSFAALEGIPPWVDRGRWTALVEVRQRYLDEIARRDPAGFARWLYAGARPASDPSRYLSAAPAESARTDREEPAA